VYDEIRKVVGDKEPVYKVCYTRFFATEVSLNEIFVYLFLSFSLSLSLSLFYSLSVSVLCALQ